mmetsp:Transcript_22749/g.52059  ORF Transcript_22749/g.52059 Transcript_22749/m.52059 type:complete len:212 (-) Transcript_22749:843-1478(-)
MVLTLVIRPEEGVVYLQVGVHEAEEPLAEVLRLVGPVADGAGCLVQEIHPGTKVGKEVLLLDVVREQPGGNFRDKLHRVVHPPRHHLALLGHVVEDAVHVARHGHLELVRRLALLPLLLHVLLPDDLLSAAHPRIGRGLEDLRDAGKAALLVPGGHPRHGPHQRVVGLRGVFQLVVLVLPDGRMDLEGLDLRAPGWEGDLLRHDDVVGGRP